MKVINIAKTVTFITAMATMPLCAKAYNNSTRILTQEEKVDTFKSSITPQGTLDKAFLAKAPSPDITIAGEKKKAGIIVDLKKNILYRYDEIGNVKNAYLIASGAPWSKTDTGVRIVSHIETSPYRNAPAGSKRRRAPKDYGPKILILNILDPKTGKQSYTGEFIHGCRSYHDTFIKTKDRRVSHGCMRMDNGVILTLSKEVKPGEIVIIDYFD